MYKQLKKFNFKTNQFDDFADAVLRVADNATIPFNSDNTDYQKYLKWLDEGNTPQEADNVTN